MPHTIPERYEFRPSRNFFEKWRATRKRAIKFGGADSLPGQFSTDPHNDNSMFWIAISIEILGFILLLQGGINKGGYFLIASFIAAVVFVAIDFFAADRLHRDVAAKCLWKNVLFANIPKSGATAIQHNQHMRDTKNNLERVGKWNIIGWSLALVFVAICKVLSILLLGSFEMVFYVGLAILYGFVAYIHINYTGYYFAERTANKILQQEYDAWAKGDHVVEGAPVIPFSLSTPLKPLHSPLKITKKEELYENDLIMNGGNWEIYHIHNNTNPVLLPTTIVVRAGEPHNLIVHHIHKIVYLGSDDQSQHNYAIEVKGSMLDEDIQQLLAAAPFNDFQKKEIARHCVSHQTNY